MAAGGCEGLYGRTYTLQYQYAPAAAEAGLSHRPPQQTRNATPPGIRRISNRLGIAPQSKAVSNLQPLQLRVLHM